MKNRIAIGLVLIGILVISIMPVSAGLGKVIDGSVNYSNGTACLNIDSLKITNLNTGAEWNKTTIPELIYAPGDNYFILTLDDPVNIGSGNILQYFAQCGAETNTSTRIYSGVDLIDYNIYLDAPAPVEQPDLTPTFVWDNPGKGAYLFANEPNDIKVRINNTGIGNASAFDVTLEIDSYTETKSVSPLAAGASTEVTFTGYAPTTPGVKTVNITADKTNAVAESDEGNNLNSTSRTVYYNGYKGKRWTGGADIVTVETYNIQGDVIYSTGTSGYTYGNWTSISASWSPTDLPIPSTATVLSAKLYVYYNWNRTVGYPLWGDNTIFNGITYPKSGATHYSDVKGWGSVTYAAAGNKDYGTLVYDVTSNFNTSGNTLSLGDGSVRDVAMDGMILQVVYSDASEPQRMIWINEGYDLFLVDKIDVYGTDPTETIAYAPFTGGPSINLAKVASAKLIAVGLGVSNTTEGKNKVIFNLNIHTDALPYSYNLPPGSAVIDVTSELGTSNIAAIQDNRDAGGMRAATTILVVEERLPTLTVNKVLIPSTDTGLFNLTIDGVTKATDVSNDGTTGPVQVSIGTHTVSEIAGSGTDLSKYTKVISGDCNSVGTVTLASGESKVCTITNSGGMKIDLGGSYDTEVGRHIMVPIKGNNFEQFYGTVNMNFSYEASIFDFVAVHSNPQSTVTAYNDNPGILSISAWNTAGVKGDVVLATVELEVMDGEGTSPVLSLDIKLLQDIYGATINRYIVDATVNIKDPSAQLKVDSATSEPVSTLGNGLDAILNENGRPRHTGDNETVITAHVTDAGLGIDTVTVDLSAIGGSATTLMSNMGSGNYNVTTKATAGINGTYSFNVTAKDNGGNTNTKTTTNNLTIYRRGDVKRNNIVDMGDALYIARYTVGMQAITNQELFDFVGDVMQASDYSHIVDMGDALYIARHSVGLEPAP